MDTVAKTVVRNADQMRVEREGDRIPWVLQASATMGLYGIQNDRVIFQANSGSYRS
jgi:hypothetical protein